MREVVAAPRPTSDQGRTVASPVRALLAYAAVVEAFLLALTIPASLGGLLQSVSPLARQWPWLTAPARALYGPAAVTSSLLPDRGWPVLVMFGVLLVGATCAFALAVLVARDSAWQGRGALALVLGVTLIFGITFVLLPSLPSDDVFSYILYGRISAVHHANPLITTPANFPHDRFLFYVFWRTTRSVYGPVWLLLSQGISGLAEGLGGSLATYVLLFKLVGLVSHLACAWLIWLILGRIAPRRRLFGTLLYAWNPLCLLEFCASAHNDVVMLLFLLLAVYALVCQREALAMICFGLSISTKYVPLVLLPFYGLYLAHCWRAQGWAWRRVAGGLGWRLGVIVGVLVLLMVPFWSGPATLGSLLFSPPAQKLDNSFAEGLKWPLRAAAAWLLRLPYQMVVEPVDTALKGFALVLFALLWVRQFRRTRSFEGMLQAWTWVLVWYALVAAGWFWPWYITWVIALVALLPWSRVSVTALLLSGGCLTLYTFLPMQSSPIFGYRALFSFGPAVGYLLWLAWRDGGWWSGLRAQAGALRRAAWHRARRAAADARR